MISILLTRLFLLAALIFTFSCEESKPADSESSSAGSGGRDVVVQGTLAIDGIGSEISGEEGISLKKREVVITDETEKLIAKAYTGNDGSYVITVPGSLAINTGSESSENGGSLSLNGKGMVIQSVISDTSDETVIGFQRTIDMSAGDQNLGKNQLEKITAIRGKIILKGSKDNSGIVVYIPGTSFDARTDVGGNFLLTFITAGSYELRIEKDGYVPLKIDKVDVVEKETANIGSKSLNLSGGTTQFSVNQVGKEGYSQVNAVDFIIDSGNADRFKAGLLEDVEIAPYGTVVDAFRYDFPGDGEYTLKFMFANADGFESSALRTIVIDSTAPEISGLRLADRTSLSTTHTNENQVIVFDDDCNDVDRVAIQGSEIANTPSFDKFIYPCHTFAEEGAGGFAIPSETSTFSYKLWAIDKAGNISKNIVSSSITVDEVLPPSPSAILTDQTSNSSLGTDFTTVNVGFSDCNDIAKIVFSEAQTLPPHPSLFQHECSASDTYTYSFYTNQQGSKSVYFWSMDYAGNISATSSSSVIVLDQTAPFAPSFTLADPTSGVSGFTNDPSAQASIVNCNDVAQVLISDAQVTKPSEDTAGWQDCALSGVQSPITSQGNGVTVYLWAKDIGGNVSEAATTTTINVDTIAPDASGYTLVLEDATSQNQAYTNAQSVNFDFNDCSTETVSIYLSESSTPPAEEDFVIQCNSGVGSKTGIFNIASATNETKTVYTWVKDVAGNISANYLTTTIVLDTVDPSLPSSFEVNDVDTGSSSFTNSVDLDFTVDVCPAGHSVYIKQDQTPPPGENESHWVACSTSGSATNVVSAGAGLKTVYLWIKDEAGNIVGSLNHSTTWDDVAPPSPVVTTPASSSIYTQSTTLSFVGTAEALGTVTVSGGASNEEFSVDGSGNWSGDVTLNDNSTHNLQLRAKDRAGNLSNIVYLYPSHDTIAPTISNIQIKPLHDSVTITWYTNEATDTYLDWDTSTSYSNNETTVGYSFSHTVTIGSLAQASTYYFKIHATDQAGNSDVANDLTTDFKTYIEKAGTISTNETWSNTTTSYYVSDNILLSNGSTITIQPGVTIVI